jgi:hypothetical protein
MFNGRQFLPAALLRLRRLALAISSCYHIMLGGFNQFAGFQ